MCGGELAHSVEHPTRRGERLFLLFDFTHNLKNIFNKFVNKERFRIPIDGYEDIFGNSCFHLLNNCMHWKKARNALFSHMKQLYALEES